MAAATKDMTGVETEWRCKVRKYNLSIALQTVQMKDFGACHRGRMLRHGEYRMPGRGQRRADNAIPTLPTVNTKDKTADRQTQHFNI